MKHFAYILALSGAIVCSNGMLKAASIAAAPDTLNQYIIDNKTVDQFDGSQLEGKKIVSYKIVTVASAPNDAVRIHTIRTKSTTQSDEPVYVIDNKLSTKRKFENLKPAQIKSIVIVKNGSVEEVRQYPGWENGVILVETKEDDYTAGTKDTRVNIGYGVEDQRDIPYAISSIKRDDNEVYSNMYDYLRGKVAGVEVRPDKSIFIRGHNSMYASMDPLILLDGTEITDLNLVNPYDVYSVDVLKDASATIYGMKGANGVILITTKAGQQAKEAEAARANKNRKNR